MKKDLSNFDSSPLTCDFTLFPGKNSLNIAKSNRIFPGNGKGDKKLILTYLGRPMAEVLLHNCLFSSISTIFMGKRRVKIGPQVLTFGQSLLHKNLKSFKKFQTMLLFAGALPVAGILAILDHIWG